MTESEIIWLEDPIKFPYLREILSFDLEPKSDERDRVVGYSRTNAQCCRKFYWMDGYDGKGPYEHDLCPSEAVLPGSIQANTCSLRYGPVLARKNGFKAKDEYSLVAMSEWLEPSIWDSIEVVA